MKKIINLPLEDKSEKYNFEIEIVSNESEVSKHSKETIILVNNNEDIEKSYNSLSNTIKLKGFITVNPLEIYNKFNSSGIWKYKHLYLNDLVEAKKELNKIQSNNIYLVIWCNEESNIIELNELLEIVSNNNTGLETWFSMPIVYSESKKSYEIGIFFK